MVYLNRVDFSRNNQDIIESSPMKKDVVKEVGQVYRADENSILNGLIHGIKKAYEMFIENEGYKKAQESKISEGSKEFRILLLLLQIKIVKRI